MADNSGGNGGLYFIVGALVVVVAVIGAVVTGHMPFFGGKHVDVIKIEAAAAPGK
jgi:Mn2+/Fe2+ NRAMP family transporter